MTYSQEELDQIKAYTKAAADKGILSLSWFEIKNDFPKTAKVLQEYCANLVSLPGADVDDETMVGVLLYTPRGILYNFLDEQKQYVNITGIDNIWEYHINTLSGPLQYTGRNFAEADAFKEAFLNLEKSL